MKQKLRNGEVIIEGEFEYISGKFYAYEIIEQMLEL